VEFNRFKLSRRKDPIVAGWYNSPYGNGRMGLQIVFTMEAYICCK